MILQMFHGFCMALADSVPGVSGGTVAFILGFYEKFLGALHHLFGADRTRRRDALLYLTKLGLGWCGGMALSVMALSRLFDAQIYLLSSLFLGLTAASLPFIVRSERMNMTVSWKNALCAILGVALVCGLTLFRASAVSGGAIDYWALGLPQIFYLFAAGILAIAAMVLPGISGSTLLLIFGAYLPTIQAVHGFLKGDFAVLPGLAALGLGVLFGAASSVRLIRAALRKYRPQMLYLIMGLMLGSLYAIVMGPATLAVPHLPLTLATFSPLGFALGIMILLGLEKLKVVTAQKEAAPARRSAPIPPQGEHS